MQLSPTLSRVINGIQVNRVKKLSAVKPWRPASLNTPLNGVTFNDSQFSRRTRALAGDNQGFRINRAVGLEAEPSLAPVLDESIASEVANSAINEATSEAIIDQPLEQLKPDEFEVLSGLTSANLEAVKEEVTNTPAASNALQGSIETVMPTGASKAIVSGLIVVLVGWLLFKLIKS